MSLACEFVPSRRLFLPRHLCFACAHVWALGAESTPHLLGALRHACQALAVPCQLLHPEPTHLPPPPDGRASERRGDEDEALDWYEKAVDLDPKCWRALFHVGKISLQFGWAADAADYFKQVLQDCSATKKLSKEQQKRNDMVVFSVLLLISRLV